MTTTLLSWVTDHPDATGVECLGGTLFSGGYDMTDFYVVLGARGFLTYNDEKREPAYCTSANDAATFSTPREALRVAQAFGAGVCACDDGPDVSARLLTLPEVHSHIIDDETSEQL